MWEIDSHKNGIWGAIFKPWTSMSDQDKISPYNINTLSTT